MMNDKMECSCKQHDATASSRGVKGRGGKEAGHNRCWHSFLEVELRWELERELAVRVS